jgi:hypothetical protein
LFFHKNIALRASCKTPLLRSSASLWLAGKQAGGLFYIEFCNYLTLTTVFHKIKNKNMDFAFSAVAPAKLESTPDFIFFRAKLEKEYTGFIFWLSNLIKILT